MAFKVDGYPDLARDSVSGAIISINSSEIQKARQMKAGRKNKEKSDAQLVDDVEQLKTDMKMIHSMLKKLLEK